MRLGWKRVVREPNEPRAELMRLLLVSKGIQAVVLNKKDSAYRVFGTCEIYVPQAQAQEAKELLVHAFPDG